jgi:alpha-tubulin suppressor-like RCC1 family protein
MACSKGIKEMNRLLGVQICAVVGLIVGCLLPSFHAGATQPAWWTSSGAVNANAVRDDDAVVTEGQLKQFTLEAVNQLNAYLPTGAGPLLNGTVAYWEGDYSSHGYNRTNPKPSDLQAMNIGQVKEIAYLVWTQLKNVGYVTTIPSWIVVTSSDYQAANIGQVKTAFDFDLTYSSDGNPLPNWWREYYFGTLSVSSATTFELQNSTFTYLQAWQNDFDPLPPPVFSPPIGVLGSSTSVSISAAGSTSIYYTTNGSDPATYGTLYTGPLSTSGITSVRAVAYDGWAATQESTFQMYANAPLAAGQNHSLAIRPDGTVWAWGYNGFGQLGISSAVDQWYPAQVSFSLPAIGVAAGLDHSLALTNNGQVWAWGYNRYGQIGVAFASVSATSSPMAVSSATGVVAIAAGQYHSLALTSAGGVIAWGLGTSGQLGDNSTSSSPTAVTVDTSLGAALSAVRITAGGNFSAAIDSGSNVWVWGDNGSYECGTSSGSNYTRAIEVSGVSGVVQITANSATMVALKSNGTVWTWGDNTYGELGNNSSSPTKSATPVEVLNSSGSALTGVVQIAAGNNCAFALRSDGTLWVWGQNSYGQFGNNSSSGTNHAIQVTGASGVGYAAISEHSLLLLSNGAIVTSGANPYGELGIGTASSSGTNTFTQTALTMMQPAAPTFSLVGGYYTSAQSDTISCTSTQAVIHYTMDGSTPTPVSPSIPSGQSISIATPCILRAASFENGFLPSQVTNAVYHMGYRLTAGLQHSLILNTDGSVYSWGANTSITHSSNQGSSLTGQLGLGWVLNDEVFPQHITGLGTSGTGIATSVAAGDVNSGAIVTSGGTAGTVWVWGDNSEKQCGTGPGTNTESNIPVQVPGLTGVQQIAFGLAHVVALMGNGTVECWGLNTADQLGNTGATSATPAAVSGLSGIIQVAAGDDHSLALKSDGTVWAWGGNGIGELGHGTTGSPSATPLQVMTDSGAALTGIVQIAASYNQSYALRNDGTVWAWGNDGNENLGDDLSVVSSSWGTYDEDTAVLVGTLRNVVQIACSEYNSSALLGNGTVMVWGSNTNDALASSSAGNPSLPVPVSGLALSSGVVTLSSLVTQISNGEHCLAVMNTDQIQTLWGWGANANGELGDGTLVTRYVPEMVQFSGYPATDGVPQWYALTQGLNPFEIGNNSLGIPYGIEYLDGLGLNPTLPFTPYQLPAPDGGTTAPTITILSPPGVTLD